MVSREPGESGGQHDMLNLIEQDMGLQEHLHGATLAVCDLAFEVAGRRDDFNARFVGLGYKGREGNMDYYFLTYDLNDGETLRVDRTVGAAYEVGFMDAEGREKSGQTLRREPAGGYPEFVEVNRPASDMTVADMVTVLGIMATMEPRPPRDEELKRPTQQ